MQTKFQCFLFKPEKLVFLRGLFMMPVISTQHVGIEIKAKVKDVIGIHISSDGIDL